MGPACLVVAILTMALFFAVCGFASWWKFSDQHALAEKGITQQLIPWVERSQLASEDKRSIVNQLNALIPKLQAQEFEPRQMTRLHFGLQDNPVLLWGNVQSILAQAPSTELTEVELASLERTNQRLLRMAAERKLGRSDLEFTLQNCSMVSEDGANIEVVENLTAQQIRDFMTRAQQLLEQHDIPNESYDKTPAEAFAILLESALSPEASTP